MKFEWDPNKNRTNLQKHGIAFENVAPFLKEPFHFL